MEGTIESKGRIKQYERPPKEKWEKYLKNREETSNIENKSLKDQIEDCDAPDCWRRDIKRIINSLSFRRLQFKTQVFLSPEGDHYSDRMRHTLSVFQISTEIARKFNLSVDLTQAIALAHDIGHSPYGHAGEEAIDHNTFHNPIKQFRFHHALQGLRVLIYGEYDSRFAVPVTKRESEKYGIGPTIEIINGILNHSESYRKNIDLGTDRWRFLEEIVGVPEKDLTPEGECVRISDEISQCIHDIADAYQSHLIDKKDMETLYRQESELPSQYGEELENFLISRIIEKKCLLDLDEEGWRIINGYKELMKEKVYTSQDVIVQDLQAEEKISNIFKLFLRENFEIGKMRSRRNEKVSHKIHRNIYELQWVYRLDWPRIVANYIAGMTDRYLDNLHRKIFG